MKQLDLITSQGSSDGEKMKSKSRGRESNKKKLVAWKRLFESTHS